MMASRQRRISLISARTVDSKAERTVLAQESDHVAIIIPDNIFDRRSGDLSQDLLLLNVIENDS